MQEKKRLDLVFSPRDYQDAFHGDFLATVDGDREIKNNKALYSSPTGTGKSVMLLRAHAWRPFSVLITPRLEIIKGFLEKGGYSTEEMEAWSDERMATEALQYGITTPVRLRNMLAKGTFPFQIDTLLIDEAHHAEANTYKEIEAYLGPDVLQIGLTATPFRGTPKETAKLLEEWGGQTTIIDVQYAADNGFISIPNPVVWPLVDDDLIQITNGEFQVNSVSDAVVSAFDALIMRLQDMGFVSSGATPDAAEVAPPQWDRTTLFALPTTASCIELVNRLNGAGFPAEYVLQDTPRAERNRIFAAAMRREIALVQIDVVSEGVDLPFRRLIDLRATMSPVKWLQQVGRTTRPLRPGEAAPEYYCCNRNLERHGYLYEGMLPSSAFKQAQEAFGKPSARAMSRATGLENVGRFTAIELPFRDGTIGQMYQMVGVDGYKVDEYAAIVHPAHKDILYATRTNYKSDSGELKYSKWRACEGLPDLTGFGSKPAKRISDKQKAWWERSAMHYGLDPRIEKVNQKNFAALPILTDLGARQGGG